MLLVIIAYDQLLFRPIVAWADKFRFEQTAVRQRARLPGCSICSAAPERCGALASPLAWAFARACPSIRISGAQAEDAASLTDRPGARHRRALARARRWPAPPMPAGADRELMSRATLGWADVSTAVGLGLLTLARVVVLIALATLIWVPIGVWIGLRPRAAPSGSSRWRNFWRRSRPTCVPGLRRRHRALRLEPEYLAQPADDPGHAVVHSVQRHRRRERVPDRSAGGRNALPAGSRMVAKRHCPGIFPYYVTGAITASGGSWNASIVAEVASWGNQSEGRRPRRLYRESDRSRRLSARRARHRRDVRLRHRVQSSALATALSGRRGALSIESRSAAIGALYVGPSQTIGIEGNRGANLQIGWRAPSSEPTLPGNRWPRRTVGRCHPRQRRACAAGVRRGVSPARQSICASMRVPAPEHSPRRRHARSRIGTRPDAALALRLVTALAFERTDAGLLQLHGIERIDAGDLCVELRSGKFVERLKGAPRVRIPAAVGGADQATDPSQFDLQQARRFTRAGAGPNPGFGIATSGWPVATNIGALAGSADFSLLPLVSVDLDAVAGVVHYANIGIPAPNR